ncbi:MAG: type II secretion system protein [Opitutales bacterium]
MTLQRFRSNPPARAGFTMIELIAVIGIIGVLFTLLGAGYNLAMDSAATARETSAARNAMTAFDAYAQEHKGRLMPGHQTPTKTVRDAAGQPVLGPAASRWYWKLLPYLDNNSEALFVNESGALYSEILRQGKEDPYTISLYPSLGYNGQNVGGDFENPRFSPENGLLGPNAVVTRLAQAHNPGDLIVFVSAWSEPPSWSDADYAGFWNVTAPRGLRTQWSTAGDPGATGHVHARHDGHAVVAFLDGHVELKSLEALSDMRLWSNAAAIANEADYRPTISRSSR